MLMKIKARSGFYMRVLPRDGSTEKLLGTCSFVCQNYFGQETTKWPFRSSNQTAI